MGSASALSCASPVPSRSCAVGFRFNLTKHGRSGLPKRRRVWLNAAMTRMYWDTSKILDIIKSGTWVCGLFVRSTSPHPFARLGVHSCVTPCATAVTLLLLPLLPAGERHIDLTEVTGIVDGCGSTLLQRAAARGEVNSGNAEKVFSLRTAARTYDFEAASVSQKKVRGLLVEEGTVTKGW